MQISQNSVFQAVLGCFLLFPGAAVAEENKCQLANTAISDASSIRGLTIKRKVPCVVQEKDDVKKYLLSALNTKIPPLKLRMEALVYKTLGFLPEDFDYEKGIVDLYLSQIGGYYDPETKRFAMAGWLPAMLQTTIAVHELTHALQDQYFDLKEFTDDKTHTGDELLARSALVEGDATAVMLDYARRIVGQPPIAKEPDVESVMMQNVIGASFSGMNQIPQSMQLLLIFPYTSGLRFAHAGLQKGGYRELDSMFRRPPLSTEEILHPEKYFHRGNDFIVIEPGSLRPAGFAGAADPIYQDVVGEFATSVLLSGVVSDKSQATKGSQGWGGDRVAVFEDQAAREYRIIWRTHWDSEGDAQEFYDLFNRHAQGPMSAEIVEHTLTKNGMFVTYDVRRKMGA